MAFSATLTGTTQSVNATNGSNLLAVTATAGWVVGATIQGTGIPTGARVGVIVANTSVTMLTAAGASANFTGTTGAVAVLVSSKYGTLLTVSQSGATDYNTPQDIYNAGFGVMQTNIAKRELFFPGGLTVTWANIVTGAVFDFLNWTLEFGNAGRWRWQESSITGELRGGFLVNGTQFLKTVGPTFYCDNWNNGGAGGSSMFENVSGTTNQGLFRFHNLRVVEISGSNAAPTFVSSRMTMAVENMVLDYQGDSAGANAGIAAAFGTLKNTYLVKANAGIGNPNPPNFATFDGLYYVGNYQSSPQYKFSLPTGYTLDGYAPQVLSSQFLGGFSNGTIETYSNINLTSAGWGLDDLKTKYLRYGGTNTLNFPRTVSLQFNDSAAANLANVTLYIRSGSTSIVNAVQSGDYSALTQALILIWNTTVNSYRVCTSFTDTIDQVAQIRKYGYQEQSVSYSLNLAAYSQPFFMLSDTSLSGYSEATAAAITTAGINWTTKTITPTADLTYDQINARIAYELAQTANSAQADPRSITGSNLTLATGWSLVVNTGRTISEGANITYLYVPTVTLTGSGKITGLYETSAGPSSIVEITASEGSSVYIGNAGTGITKLFQSGVTAGAYRLYLAPGDNTPVSRVRELYGFQRAADTITPAGGLYSFNPVDVEDVGISQTAQATVSAYTAIDNLDKFYDFTAYRRLSEDFIKLGQIATRSGTSVDIGNYNLKVNVSASVMETISGSTITIKSGALAAGAKYTTIIATPPKTVTPQTTEVITANIEDGNGDSSVTIQGGSGDFTLWKITNSTPEADYATGTNLGDVGNVTYRFLHADGFKIVIVDNVTGYRIPVSMSKGIYTRGLFFGDQVQLAQSAEVTQINTKVDILNNEVVSLQASVDGVPSSVLAASVETGATVAESLRLHNAVLGGKVSGAGTGVESFRDLADSKDRLISTVDANGNRLTEVSDLT
jgi:hypothetical protein